MPSQFALQWRIFKEPIILIDFIGLDKNFSYPLLKLQFKYDGYIPVAIEDSGEETDDFSAWQGDNRRDGH